jgi:hypothetical protein
MCISKAQRDPNRPLLRLAAVPAPHVDTDEVVVIDQTGARYLLDGQTGTLTRLSVTETQMLATFFEEVGRTCWDTVDGFVRRLQPAPSGVRAG